MSLKESTRVPRILGLARHKPHLMYSSRGNGYWVARTFLCGKCFQGVGSTMIEAYNNWRNSWNA
jgi:hypothetical protein